MKSFKEYLDQTYYSDFPTSWDQLLFREYVLQYLTPDSRLLDLGAGRGVSNYLNFQGSCSFIAGADPDCAILKNPYLDEASVLKPPVYLLPYADASFDVVMSANVLEHLTDVDLFFGEVARVLRPGGYFLAKTPNKNHYVCLFSEITPHWFHEWYNRRRGREHQDTFPTTYPCNTKREVIETATRNGFSLSKIMMIEGRPEYLRFNTIPYLFGMIYERVVNRFSSLENFRCVIMFCLKK